MTRRAYVRDPHCCEPYHPNGPRKSVAQSRRRKTNTMIMERGARPDALPKPKRRRTVLVGVVGVGVGLALALDLGVGLGPGIKRYLSTPTPHPSLCCTGNMLARATPRPSHAEFG
jgi:hypothetical protein